MNAFRQASLGLRGASLIFAVVAGAHFVRGFMGWEIRIGRFYVGYGVSIATGLIAVALALLLWKLAVGLDQAARRHGTPPHPPGAN